MENIIFLNYNLRCSNLKQINESYYFECNGEKYLFDNFDGDVENLKKLVDFLNQTNIPYHLMVINKNNSIVTKSEDKNYILMKIRADQQDIYKKYNYNVPYKVKINWNDLWIKRVDYYELQVEELKLNNVVKYSLQYYIGVVEIVANLVKKYNSIYDSKNINYAICHYNLKLANYNSTFFNPCNMLIDIDVRDFCEYIKNSFYDETMSNDQILKLIDKNKKLNNISIHYFLARLLYPSVFFEAYEGVINGEENEKILFIIKKSNEFELLYNNIYSLLSRKFNDLDIYWPIKSQH